MEWRCEWCGKPHEADDPPCDNCGHGSFERAVVQRAADAPGGSTTTVWVCTECGREHPKHSPPCSRCGNATLERTEQTFDEGDLTVPGYLDLVTPRYALGLIAVLGLASVLALGFAGVVDLPGLDSGVPSVEDVPGDPGSYGGTSLAAVETAYVDQLNQRRRDSGARALQRDDHLDDVARYYNQLRVRAILGPGNPPSAGQLEEFIGDSCGRRVFIRTLDLPASAVETTGDELGGALADARVVRYGTDDPLGAPLTGVDVHAGTDETLYATQITC